MLTKHLPREGRSVVKTMTVIATCIHFSGTHADTVTFNKENRCTGSKRLGYETERPRGHGQTQEELMQQMVQD